MRIAYLTAGAAGMFCGSCLRDNALVGAMRELGHDVVLTPLYTPIRTDEVDRSEQRLFFGGVNVYLQEKTALFRYTPRFLDQWLDSPRLIKRVAKNVDSGEYGHLGTLTLSMLRGVEGRQRKELYKLLNWFQSDFPSEMIVLSNVLLSGVAALLHQELKVPIAVLLQGDDLFLDGLRDSDRQLCLEQIRKNDSSIRVYLATSQFYADKMARYLGIARDKIEIAPPGISLEGFEGPRPDRLKAEPTVGYFARICPEKGFHHLVRGFIRLRHTAGSPPAKLRVSGFLGSGRQEFFDHYVANLRAAGLIDDFEYVRCETRAEKIAFLKSIDLLSVPTEFEEPKGLYVFEALAAGTPVLLPDRGAFPEWIAATGGGLLHTPDDPVALANGMREMISDFQARERFTARGMAAVREKFSAKASAEETLRILITARD